MSALLAEIQIFASIATAIFLEAAPFLLLGSAVAAAFEVFAPPDLLAKVLGGGRVRGVAVGLLAGLVLPTCECGVVPITRRLLARGAPPHTAITYMLAAPVINPIVLLSTWVAFQGDWFMVAGRVILVAFPAAVVGYSVGKLPAALLLKHGADAPSTCSCGHDHGAGLVPVETGSGSCSCGHDHAPVIASSTASKLRALAAHTADEFMSMSKYLILGCLAAAAVKAYVPSSVLQAFSGNPITAVLVMMALAIGLSVCSEADAFVAASLTTFPAASQLAFLAIGPMVDLKLIAMFQATFHPRVMLVLILVPIIMVATMSITLGVGLGW